MFRGTYFFSLMSSCLIISSFMFSKDSFIFLRWCNFCASLTVISFVYKVTINSWYIAPSVQPLSVTQWNARSLILKSVGKHTKTRVRFGIFLFVLIFFIQIILMLTHRLAYYLLQGSFYELHSQLHYSASDSAVISYPSEIFQKNDVLDRVPLCTSVRCLL